MTRRTLLPSPEVPALRFAKSAFLLVALPIAGCGVFSVFAPTHVRRGEMVDQEALRQLVPGTSTRADATSLLGSPTAHATFDDNTWLYIGQVTSTRIGRTPGVTAQKVVALNFDASGTLRDIRELNRADGRDIAMASGATPSPGSEATFMQQLLGNVGQFKPAGIPGGGGGGFGSSIGPSTGGGGNSLP